MADTNITDWSVLVTFFSSPVAMVVLTVIVWKMTGEMKGLKEEVNSLKKSIYENGFLRKGDLDEAWKRGDEVHKRHDEAINELRADVNWLRARE